MCDERIEKLKEERDNWKLTAERHATEKGFLKQVLKEIVSGDYEKAEEWLTEFDRWHKSEIEVTVDWKSMGVDND